MRTRQHAESIFADGAAIVRHFVKPGDCDALVAAIDEGEWSTEIGRRVQHYGHRYSYSRATSSRTMPAPPFPPWADKIADRLSAYFEVRPNQCIVNEYHPGQGIGMHSDAASFGPTIASLSLGAAWPMRFRAPGASRYERGGMLGDECVTLPVGSLLVLEGEARRRWMHGICRKQSKWEKGRRVSATFRTVA